VNLRAHGEIDTVKKLQEIIVVYAMATVDVGEV